MEIISVTFRLGVILAIFGFLWSLIRFGAELLSNGRMKVWQNYLLKLIKNFFLVQITFLFCYETDSALSLSQSSVVITTIILLIYFVSKLQNNQQKRFMLNFMMNQQVKKPLQSNFDIRAEIGLIVLSMFFFVACIYYPTFAENKISFWMKDAIINIEDTPVFGFIFKIVGVFFLFSIFNKIAQSIMMIFAPSQFRNIDGGSSNEGKKKGFDDYEDVSEDK